MGEAPDLNHLNCLLRDTEINGTYIYIYIYIGAELTTLNTVNKLNS